MPRARNKPHRPRAKKTALRYLKRRCGTKNRYASKEAAEQGAMNHRMWQGGTVGAYHCRTCKYWHIGHRR